MTNGQRKLMFGLCKELNIDDEGRRIMAGSFRKDGEETTKGMEYAESQKLIIHLKELKRRRGLKKRKRVHGDGKHASVQWRHTVKVWAQEIWGDSWEVELNQVIARHNGGVFLFWTSEKIPSGLFRKVSEEIKDRAARGKTKNKPPLCSPHEMEGR